MEAFGSNLSEEQVIISFVLASGICIWLTQPVVRTCMCTYVQIKYQMLTAQLYM